MGSGLSLEEIKNFRFRINPVESEVGRDMFGYRIMRPMSLYLTWLFLRIGTSANTITSLQLLIGLLGAAVIAWGDTTTRLFGVLLLYFGFLLDNCDGEVARFKGQVTVTGQFLDNFGHHMVNSAILAAIGVAAWRSTGHVEALVLGFAASLAGQRVDLSLAMAQAQQAADKPLDQAYSYFENSITIGEESLLDNLQGQAKKSDSWIRRLAFGFFSYPSIIHWLLFLSVVQLALRLFASLQDGIVWLAAAWIYGIFLPLRRASTLRTIVVSRVPDQLFLALTSHRLSKRNR